MKILTYHQNIDNFPYQDKLLSFWDESWKSKGFLPIILTENDAKKSDFYEEFVSKIQKLNKLITKKPIGEYDLSCWLRWLAYSTQPEEKLYVSDYDVINHNFYPKEPEDILHLMDNNCPCFVSGKPSQFFNLCKKFINITNENLDKFTKIYQEFKFKFKRLHDQNFFIIYFTIQKIDKDIKLSKDRNFLSTPAQEKFWEKPLVHYSHHACTQFCKKNNLQFEYTFEDMNRKRCSIIREHIHK